MMAWLDSRKPSGGECLRLRVASLASEAQGAYLGSLAYAYSYPYAARGRFISLSFGETVLSA